MIEKIVTSLEVSKKLKKLGIIQESIFYWVKDNVWKLVLGDNQISRILKENDGNRWIVSAWTVTELGAMWGEEETDETLFTCNPDNEAQHIIEYLKTHKKPFGFGFNQNLKEWRKK